MAGDGHPCHGSGRERLRAVQPGGSRESSLRSQQPTARPDRSITRRALKRLSSGAGGSTAGEGRA